MSFESYSQLFCSLNGICSCFSLICLYRCYCGFAFVKSNWKKKWDENWDSLVYFEMQPGPRDFSNQCLIKRNKKTSTFYLYLALTPCKLFQKYYFSFCFILIVDSVKIRKVYMAWNESFR